MADETRTDKLTLEELMVSTLAMTDAVTKLLIAKGVFTDEEFKVVHLTPREHTNCIETTSGASSRQKLPQALHRCRRPLRSQSRCTLQRAR